MMVKSDIIYFVVLPPAQHHSFFRNLLLLFLSKHTQTPQFNFKRDKKAGVHVILNDRLVY